MFDFDELDEVDPGPQDEKPPSNPLNAYSPYHRWAVNIDDWDPEGAENGPEFQFLLSLIREETDRAQVMKYIHYEDKKRALMSRLLMRCAAAEVLGLKSFSQVEMKRTKGKKPFLASPLPKDFPNFNCNVSHEGSWVVLASDPLAVCGIDVAAPTQNRSGKRTNFRRDFEEQLTPYEWGCVDQAGPEYESQYEVFQRHWSCKEAFVKARGDGLAFPLGDAEFHCKDWKGNPGMADGGPTYEATVVVKKGPSPSWRFFQYRLPGNPPHWVTVARGPLDAVVDKLGEFTATLRKKKFTEEEWKQALAATNPPFQVLTVNQLVPEDHLDEYVRSGGKRP
eukprot:gnl/MRDRNA2_/MRDRNA2_124152_c0_seq1.p1 gnl/MRDRNA2_/MRDRNA2_124152_c0~~gnl/MRDRNA2_/MRDRNA2_124152_c0_seq1.p1  ORF type:complete len:336 (+),score=65.24 gnl/MRDRNA2_/MRDRNA2_124152_c0_seq1:91-1098(+)